MSLQIPVLLDRINFVVWELEIIKALTGNSALAGVIRGLKTLESSEDDEVETELTAKAKAYQNAKTEYENLERFVDGILKSYRVTNADEAKYRHKTAKEIVSKFGFPIYEQWLAIKGGATPPIANPDAISLKDIETDIDSLTEKKTKSQTAEQEYEVAKHRKTQHFAVYSDSKKRLRAEAGLLCNLIMSFGPEGLVNPYYLQSLKSSSKWTELEGYQARADVKKLMDCLHQIQNSSNHSCSTHVLIHVWRLQPYPGEVFYEYDRRMYEAVEYLRRDGRDKVEDKHLIQLYRENLRPYCDTPEVARFVENYKVVEESPTFDEYRRRFLAWMAEALYYRETNSGNFSSTKSPEEMIVCAAVGTITCQICSKKGHSALQCRKYLAQIKQGTIAAVSAPSSTNPSSTASASSQKTEKKPNLAAKPDNSAAKFVSAKTGKQNAQTKVSQNPERDAFKKKNKQGSKVRSIEIPDDLDIDELLYNVVVARSGKSFDTSIQLDNGANAHILNDKRFFENGPMHLRKTIDISGIYATGNYPITKGGMTKSFGFSFYDPRCRNILSQSRLEKDGYTTHAIKNGTLTVAWEVSKGDKKFRFCIDNGIYVATTNEVLIAAMMTRKSTLNARITETNSEPLASTAPPIPVPETPLTAVDDTIIQQISEPTSGLQTALTPPISGVVDQTSSVTEPIAESGNNEVEPSEPSQDGRPYVPSLGRRLTKAEETRVNAVGALHVTLGHAGRATELKAISGGHILSCPITAKDIQIYYEIAPPCIGCLKGKMRQPPSIPFSPPSGAKVGAYWEADICYIGPRRYIILVEVISGFALSIPVATRHELSINHAAKVWHTFIGSYFSPSEITVYTDREAALQGLATGGPVPILVTRTPAETHANRAEVLIRTIKERARSVIFSLPYKLPSAVVDYLVRYIVNMKNYLPSTTKSDETPLEIVRGVKVEYSAIRDLQFGLTGYAVVPSGQRSSKDDATSEEGILVGFDLTNPRNRLIYLVRSKRVVSRLKFVAGPISKEGMAALSTDAVSISDFALEAVFSSMVLPMEHDVSNMSIREAIKIYGEEETHKSIKKELENMENMNVFKFVNPGLKIPDKIYPSKLFIKSKFSDGKFTKLKSRLVLRGVICKESTTRLLSNHLRPREVRLI